jgi:hypothetical protein
MMTCKESQKAFSPYLDGVLPREASDALDEHLGLCPVCRHQFGETRAVVRALSIVARPAPPAGLAASVSEALTIEGAARGANPPMPLHERVARWVSPHVMPYAVGALYSMILFVAVFGALRQQLRLLRNLADEQALESGQPYSVTWVDGGGGYDVTRPLSPDLSVAARAPFTSESPTLNPRGALAALTLSPPSARRPDDDDMIVVADVYSNGSASLAEVVAPPRNRHMIDEFQDALRQSPAFVPASLDRRPQTMRVVFVLQKMNVPESSF